MAANGVGNRAVSNGVHPKIRELESKVNVASLNLEDLSLKGIIRAIEILFEKAGTPTLKPLLLK